MIYFKKELKDYVLKGRTIRYVAPKLDVHPTYLGDVLRGYKSCSRRLSKQILQLISPEAKFSDYFMIKEK